MDCQHGRPAINGWVYFLGEMNGEDIKIGRSTGETMRSRVAQVNAEQTTNARYELLAALRADAKDEAFVKRYFADIRRDDKGRRTEYFLPESDLSEYVNWLRQWWWVTLEKDEAMSELEAVSPELWLPSPERRMGQPEEIPGQLIQPHRDLEGTLAGTPWDWLLSPKQSVQDYFTPPEIIDAARQAMGDIDLDAASHPLANRVHQIPDFFHINRSAFDNDWHGRVWLNPPYGNNAPWFERIVQYVESGEVEQLCILSPMWAFTTEIAKPMLRMSAATVLLSPTPRFWGNASNRTGVNHPHGIVYFGDRVNEFLAAFTPFGIPVRMAWDEVAA